MDVIFLLKVVPNYYCLATACYLITKTNNSSVELITSNRKDINFLLKVLYLLNFLY